MRPLTRIRGQSLHRWGWFSRARVPASVRTSGQVRCPSGAERPPSAGLGSTRTAWRTPEGRSPGAARIEPPDPPTRSQMTSTSSTKTWVMEEESATRHRAGRSSTTGSSGSITGVDVGTLVADLLRSVGDRIVMENGEVRAPTAEGVSAYRSGWICPSPPSLPTISRANSRSLTFMRWEAMRKISKAWSSETC